MTPVALPFGDINLLVTTDVHSWIAGHSHRDHEPEQLDANFGTLVSFVERVKAAADAQHKDVFFFDNGDVVDGTALSESKVTLFSLLTRVPYDALNCGNHELYRDDTIQSMLTPLPGGDGHSFVNHWGGRYLSSNIDLAGSGGPLGSARYALLRGKHGASLLVLGFMYDMEDHCASVNVTHVHEAVRRPWFHEAMRQLPGVDAVIVLGHMDYADPLVNTILRAIRTANATVPVQFLTGHSHIRAFARLDAHAVSFEAGNYGNTVGFASFNVSKPHRSWRSGSQRAHAGDHPASGRQTILPLAATATEFAHVPIDMATGALAAAVGLPTAANLTTPRGALLSRAITSARAAIGATTPLGCAPCTFRLLPNLTATDSMWGLYLGPVTQQAIFCPPRNTSQWFLSSTGALRYPLFAGLVVVDDIDTALPFSDRLYIYPRILGRHLEAALQALNRPDQASMVEEKGAAEVEGSEAAVVLADVRTRRRRPASKAWEDERHGKDAGMAAADDAGVDDGQRDDLWIPRPAPRHWRTLASGAPAFPRYVAHSMEPLHNGTRYYDAIVGGFDRSAFERTLRAIYGPTLPVPSPIPYVDEMGLSCGDGNEGPPATDTEAWMRWAKQLPLPPCHVEP